MRNNHLILYIPNHSNHLIIIARMHQMQSNPALQLNLLTCHPLIRLFAPIRTRDDVLINSLINMFHCIVLSFAIYCVSVM
jgi:hypothetical protein